jgi:hypothetical protein
MKKEQLDELEKYKAEAWEMDRLKYKDSAYREKLFLYTCKYGAKNISRMRDNVWL